MIYDFDCIIDRRQSDSVKWRVFDEDVLPLWVADMDFAAPEPVLRALRERLAHGVLGYGIEPQELRQQFAARLDQLYGWRVAPEAVVFTPGVVAGFNVATRALAQPGGGVLVQTPVYPPMLDVPGHFGMARHEMELTQGAGGQYFVDLERMAAAITDHTRLFLLCNPQNPTGRVFRRDELAAMAELCLRRNVVICSDEIHCDLLFAGQQHVPIAALAPEVAEATITLMSPSKTFNIAGLFCSMAVIPNPALRQAYVAATRDIVPHVNMMGFIAAQAAYAEGAEWLAACLRYLEANRDLLADLVAARLPGVRMARPEGTYLAWLDCRGAGISGSPAQFFLKQARVALNDGITFGRGGEGFVRLNFGCPQATLVEALERMEQAIRGSVATGY